jgi:hypothetical protein
MVPDIDVIGGWYDCGMFGLNMAFVAATIAAAAGWNGSEFDAENAVAVFGCAGSYRGWIGFAFRSTARGSFASYFNVTVSVLFGVSTFADTGVPGVGGWTRHTCESDGADLKCNFSAVIGAGFFASFERARSLAVVEYGYAFGCSVPSHISKIAFTAAEFSTPGSFV